MSNTSPSNHSDELAKAYPESINNLCSEVFGIEAPLPNWASAPANGNWLPSAQLCTRDGRVTGNSVLMWWTIRNGMPTAVVATDAGNVIFTSLSELEQMFYPPQFLMREPLYAHIAGIMSADVEIPEEYMFLFEAEFAPLDDEIDYDFDEDFGDAKFNVMIIYGDSNTITASFDTVDTLNTFMAQRGLSFRI